MAENDQYPNNVVENKMQLFKNGEQSALNYVQTAIEKGHLSTQDATQNLVNEKINRRNKKM
jgi:hypothetical protein